MLIVESKGRVAYSLQKQSKYILAPFDTVKGVRAELLSLQERPSPARREVHVHIHVLCSIQPIHGLLIKSYLTLPYLTPLYYAWDRFSWIIILHDVAILTNTYDVILMASILFNEGKWRILRMN